MNSLGTVLIVSQVGTQWSAILDMLADELGYRALKVNSHAEAHEALGAAHIDLIIAEDGGHGAALGFLAGLRTSHPDIVRVLALEAEEAMSASDMLPAAIYQLVRKPLDAEQIGLVVKRGLETRELGRRHRLLSREFKTHGDGLPVKEHRGLGSRADSQRFEKLVFVSEAMAHLCELARRAAHTELPILIQGETGSGKELLARAIHYNSPRRASPLMVQNCGGMPDELLQSELFGHRRGAFAGALTDRLGLFRAADGGTVFLDEISEASPAFQLSLLRFLQDGEVKPVGGVHGEACNVRIIAAANHPLKELVAAGKYRQDLYFGLRGFELDLPPLRERPDDIPVLAEFFAAKYADVIGRKILGISAAAVERLVAFDFPGNVRELENEIRRMVALAKDGDYLTTQDMSAALLAAPPRRMRTANGFVAEGATLKDKVESLEKHIVVEALARHRWNQSRAASELGLSRVGLANKIKRYGIDQVW